MSLNLLVLGVFDLLIVCYVIFLIQQAIAFKAKYGYLCEASGLGEVKNAQYKTYNLGYFLFGFISLAFTYNLHQILIPGVITNIAIALVYIAGVALCLIAVFPRDTFHTEHTLASTVMFFCAVISMPLLVIPFLQTPAISRAIVPFNIIIPALLLYYLFLKFKNFKKYGEIDNEMERYVSIWEWIPFISAYCWFFALNTVIILRLL